MKDIQDFLKEYSLLFTRKSDLNFFQIAGFSHYENVSSNVLHYFLKNDIVLKAFLNCISLDYAPSVDYIENITREEGTGNHKRIDIVIRLVRQPGWLPLKSCNFSPCGYEVAVF
jgi:hypothetical protein